MRHNRRLHKLHQQQMPLRQSHLHLCKCWRESSQQGDNPPWLPANAPNATGTSLAGAIMSHFPHAVDQVFPKVGTTRAGVAPALLNDKFTRVSGHVFNGEKDKPNAGRHTLSAFLATHPGKEAKHRNDRNRIQEFDVRLLSFSYLTPLPMFITDR